MELISFHPFLQNFKEEPAAAFKAVVHPMAVVPTPRRLARLRRRVGLVVSGLALLLVMLVTLPGPAAAKPKKMQPAKQQKKKADPYGNRGKQLFWLQDPRDSTCLGPAGFQMCDGSAIWLLADRKEGQVLVAPFEHDTAQSCLTRKWCHSGESPVGLDHCKHCGAKHWSVTPDRRGYVRVSEDKGKNCLVRSKAQPGGKSGKFPRYRSTYEMQHCDTHGYTGLLLVEAPINDGFYLQAADGFCFDGERFVPCDQRNLALRWSVAVRFAGNGQAERYFYRAYERQDGCLQRTGKGPKVGECSHWGAKRWSLKAGMLAHDNGKMCIVRRHDNTATFAKCAEGQFEHITAQKVLPYETSLASGR